MYIKPIQDFIKQIHSHPIALALELANYENRDISVSLFERLCPKGINISAQGATLGIVVQTNPNPERVK